MLHSPSIWQRSAPRITRQALISKRQLSTLKLNPYIYIHTQDPQTHILSYLSTEPANKSLSIGTIHTPTPTTTDHTGATLEPPTPTPQNLTPNPSFLPILHSVLREHATSDPAVQAAAAAYVSAATASMGVLAPGNATSAQRRAAAAAATKKKRSTSQNTESGPVSNGGRGGWIHVSDARNPPDWARVAWPEDIFGSLEVDGAGRFVDGSDDGGGDGDCAGTAVLQGRYQESGTYRIVTREGMLGLSPFLRDRLIDRLREMEREGANR